MPQMIPTLRAASSHSRVLLAIIIIMITAFSFACFRRSGRPAPGVPYDSSAASPKMSAFLFKEEGKLYLMTVGVNAARLHDDDKFVPLAVVIANKSGPRMNLDRESFTLVDPVSGSRYGLASIDEARQQGMQVHDRRLMDMEHLGHKLQAYTMVASNFFPNVQIIDDDIELHSFQFMADTLYFPRPEGQLLGKRFELHVNAKNLQSRLYVVFDIPEK